MELKDFGGFNTSERAQWFKFDNDDAEFLIAPNDDPEFSQQSVYYGNKLQKRMTGDDPALVKEINDKAAIKDNTEAVQSIIKVYAESCLLDWKNLTLDGENYPYSKENALKLLVNFPPIYNQVVLWSLELEKSRYDKLDTLKKTSEE